VSLSVKKPQSLLAFDTDHIKKYVFGTSKLKEIRGASSLLDRLNRVQTRTIAESKPYGAQTIFAHGGSALFLLDSAQAEPLGHAIQKLYHEETGGGASITYAIQPIPDYGTQDSMTAQQLSRNVTMSQVLKLLRARLKLAKDTLHANAQPPFVAQETEAQVHESESASPQETEVQVRALETQAILALPSYILLSPCSSCGVAYAEDTRRDLDDPDEPEGRYCRICSQKRDEDGEVKSKLRYARQQAVSQNALWGHILQTLLHPGDPHNPLYNQPYVLPERVNRPKDFHAFSAFAGSKDYLGLIYADADGMGQAMDKMESLKAVQDFAEQVDKAVFAAMGDSIRSHLPAQKEQLPFDILLVGGDDIVMVTPAAQALQVAATLAERFHFYTQGQYTLSVGVVLAPITYPFGLQRVLADETIQAAKKAGAEKKARGSSGLEQSHINFVVVTGNTSLSYARVFESMHSRKPNQEEFYATMRPYALPQFQWLLTQLRTGNEMRLGRTKLHQLREAILKIDRSKAATILEALALLRNWQEQDRTFIKGLAKEHDGRMKSLQQQKETLFPWGLDDQRSTDESFVYYTPLLDFIELYDFVS
jgi:CRISPR RNA silencing complex Cmr2 subunit-like protein